MMRQQEPTSGDYGYDLVHQDVGGAPRRPDGNDRAEAPPSSGQEDTTGDYGYDEAHDF